MGGRAGQKRSTNCVNILPRQNLTHKPNELSNNLAWPQFAYQLAPLRPVSVSVTESLSLPLSLQLQWLLATGRPRTATLQVCAAQANGGQRRQAVQALHRPVATDLEGHPGCQPALNLVHALTQPGGNRRVQGGRGNGHVSGEMRAGEEGEGGGF